MLYIFWFLHQTTTPTRWALYYGSCISFDSYIKPQQVWRIWSFVFCCISFDSYIKPQLLCHCSFFHFGCISFDSYIKPQPFFCISLHLAGCISFDSYIKPQLGTKDALFLSVVYLLIPTSNHNDLWRYNFPLKLYIFWFLHQTTTIVHYL